MRLKVISDKLVETSIKCTHPIREQQLPTISGHVFRIYAHPDKAWKVGTVVDLDIPESLGGPDRAAELLLQLTLLFGHVVPFEVRCSTGDILTFWGADLLSTSPAERSVRELVCKLRRQVQSPAVPCYPVTLRRRRKVE